SDQFGFCVALWEAVTGERPFPGRTFAALREAIAAGPPLFPPVVKQVRLRQVLARGLAEDPCDRYPSMQALLDELSRVERPSRARLVVSGGASLGAGRGALLVVPQLLAVESEPKPEPPAEPIAAVGPSCAAEAERASAAVWSPAEIDALRS